MTTLLGPKGDAGRLSPCTEGRGAFADESHQDFHRYRRDRGADSPLSAFEGIT